MSSHAGPSDAGHRPPAWSQLTTVEAVAAPPTRRGVSVLLGVLVGFGSLGPIVYSRPGWATNPGSSGLAAMTILMTFISLGVVIWALTQRGRRPLLTLYVPTAIGIFLPIGPLASVLALPVVVGRWKGTGITWAAGAAGAGTMLMVVSDAVANPIGASWAKYLTYAHRMDPSADAPALAWQVLVIHALVLVVCTCAGLVQRSSWERRSFADVAASAVTQSEALSQEVARTAERERIAREVHDALGHRLSVISLHAGALSTLVSPDSPAAECAAQVQQAAAAAVDDLHELLRMLRENVDEAWPVIPLTQLQEVVDEAALAGQPVTSSVFLEDASSAAPMLSRAVFRIVQEILTNARKHAPGQPLMLRVQGSAQAGISIEASNPIPQLPGQVPEGAQTPQGRGLRGIEERVGMLGGSIEYGADLQPGRFLVRVHLPWVSAQA